ncbi:hypothetical protein [Thalassoroseus pseudoceratinae]|uniref:hypothetical protein n=1 Tax=Thalassoroseus pseudoceratinae TaxID=2713176 RepID=UPI0014226429|nr:hypothetical protein [Thalassoroseus pseudoceratinae]
MRAIDPQATIHYLAWFGFVCLIASRFIGLLGAAVIWLLTAVTLWGIGSSKPPQPRTRTKHQSKRCRR